VAVALLGGSAVQTGYAGLAVGVGLVAIYAITQAFAVELPRLSERAGSDLAGAEAAGRRLAWWVLVGLVPAAVAGALAVEPLLPLVLGDGFAAAAGAFGPALAMLPLAPLTALATQAAALRLEPERRLVTTAAGAAVFVAVALATVPAWGAGGATTALLAGAAATVLAARLVLPGTLPVPLLATGMGAAALVLAVAP
jgi:O-antigen/teichoic acid export membrane protein